MPNRISISSAIDARFEVYEWRNALAILRGVHPEEWEDIVAVTSSFELRHMQIAAKGRGNKSEMAGILDGGLYKRRWVEKAFDTKIVVDGVEHPSPTHSVDCFKNGVALEVEWNNKDPFYDRDLNNFRLLYELRVIDVGVIITRSTALRKWLHANHAKFGKKPSTFGQATTHDEKLMPKIKGGGSGGCPVLVFSIKPEAYIDDQAGA